WEEEECLDFYGMLSLHRLFEVVAAQLTHSEAAVLSFLLDEALRAGDSAGDSGDSGAAAPRGRREPRDALELLLELERRGLCHEGDLGQLRQLLRLLARHDLLRCVSLKRPRPGECHLCVPVCHLPVCHLSVTSLCVPVCPLCVSRHDLLRCVSLKRPRPDECHLCVTSLYIRLRVRAEYCEHERALRRGVASSRPRGPGRALDVFGQASGVLKSRDLGSILCDIKFSELSYLEAFWGDYLSGALLEALKGVFLTEGLRRAVGREDVRLLVSVDQDDYEAGRRLLM
ncbi:DEDD protein, partial [Molothrus ater]|nr:DEDD protein [Molothrus ater]